MRRADALHRLRKHRAEFAKLGVAHMRLFGSVARDQANEQSDIDVIVESPDGRAFGLFRLANIAEELERVLDRKADVFTPRTVMRAARFERRIAPDVIDVF